MLIEILISLTLMGSFLFQLQFLQLQQGRVIKSAYYRSVAVIQLQSLVERLRAHSIGRLSADEWQEWRMQNSELLPHATGAYVCHSLERMDYRCELRIEWRQIERQSLTLTVIV